MYYRNTKNKSYEEYSAVYSRYCPEHEDAHDGSATESNLTRKGPFHRPGYIFINCTNLSKLVKIVFYTYANFIKLSNISKIS